MTKLRLILLAISILLAITSPTTSGVEGQNQESQVTVTVTVVRRESDFYTLLSDKGDYNNRVCNEEDNGTYLVFENQCINNQDLLNGN